MAQLQSFAEAQRRDGALNRLPARCAAVEVRCIVGSVSQTKVDTLSRAFLLRKGGVNAPRYRSVLTAMRTDVPLPSIEVYALRDAYYVVDGHHRVAAARALGCLYLDALVHEFVLPPTSAENQLHNERWHVERPTGLIDLVVTEPGHYPRLLHQIREHRFFRSWGCRAVGLWEAAQEWRAYVYALTTEWLATSGVPDHFPGQTLADLYGYVYDYKWIQSQNKGLDTGFPNTLADFYRLYPPSAGAGAAVSSALHALGALVRPVVGAGRGGRAPARAASRD